MSYRDNGYQLDFDDDNPGMDSNQEYHEPDAPYEDDTNYGYPSVINNNKSKKIITKLVGVTYANSDGKSRQTLLSVINTGDSLSLYHNKYNQYDKNCIDVRNKNGEILGHISKELSAKIAPGIDKNVPYQAKVLNITGGGNLKYGCNIEISYSSDYIISSSHYQSELVFKPVAGICNMSVKSIRPPVRNDIISGMSNILSSIWSNSIEPTMMHLFSGPSRAELKHSIIINIYLSIILNQ